MFLETSHLQLRPYSPEHLLALLEGYAAFQASFGLPAAPGLRDYLESGELPPGWIAQLRASTVADPWFHGFAIVERERQQVIGSASFKGGPNADGMVEIAYGLVPAFQGRGYATESAAALIAFAFEHEQVRVIRAHTLPQVNASGRVLIKCGFQHLGEVIEPEDGLVWRWERTRDVAQAHS